MYTANLKTVRSAFLLVMVFLGYESCVRTPSIIGRWQEIGTTATLEFHKDGTFSAVDDMEMAVSGTYSQQKDGRTRFEIINPGSPPDIVWGRISMQGDEFIFAADDNKEVERYRRAK